MNQRLRRVLLMLPAIPLATASCMTVRPTASGSEIRSGRFIAAAAKEVRRCYRSPKVPHAGRQIITRLRVRYGADGTLATLPQVASQTGVTADNQGYAAPMAQAAISSVIRCAPLRVPDELYPVLLEEFFMTFSPSAVA